MSKKIEQYKELLEVLPRTNVKNSREYKKRALVMKQEIEEKKEAVLKEIKKRFLGIVIDENPEIETLKKHLDKCERELLYFDSYNDSYEKTNLNEVLYDLSKFYKNDLNKVNNDIKKALEIFNLVSIDLTEKDFKYGKEVEEYMREFFKLKGKNSEDINEIFDKLFWRCPDIFEYINICFRYLYSKNKKAFDKYCYDQVKDVTQKEVEDHYKLIYSKYLNQTSSDIKILQDKFLEGKLDIKEYEDSKVERLKASLLLKNDDDQIGNILKLSYSLYEYKNYLDFKGIIENVKKIYQDKNNKNLTKSLLKDINKNESKIIKANKKISFRTSLFKDKAKLDKYYNIINSSLSLLKELYKNYDEAKFKEIVATELNDNSTLLDALRVAYSYKIDFAKMLKQEKEDITNEEINDKYNKLKEFILYPNNNFICNTTINDNRDIITVVLDKYKLMNINLTEEQLEDVNIDSLISTVDKILVNYYINSSGQSYEKLNDACEFKKVLDSNNKD